MVRTNKRVETYSHRDLTSSGVSPHIPFGSSVTAGVLTEITYSGTASAKELQFQVTNDPAAFTTQSGQASWVTISGYSFSTSRTVLNNIVDPPWLGFRLFTTAGGAGGVNINHFITLKEDVG